MTGYLSPKFGLASACCLVWVALAFCSFNPLPCTDTSASKSCPAILFAANDRLPSENAMDIATRYGARSILQNYQGGALMLVDCGCVSLPANVTAYMALATYLVTQSDLGSGLIQISSNRFANLAWNDSGRTMPLIGETLEIHLGCGCSPSSPYLSVISYTVRAMDTITGLVERFNSTMQWIAKLNSLSNSSQIQIGQVLFLPSTISPDFIGKASPTNGVVNKRKYVEVAIAIGISVAIVAGLIIITLHAIGTRRRNHDSQMTTAKGQFHIGDFESNAQNFKGTSSSHNSFLGIWNPLLKRPSSVNSNPKRAITLPGDAKGVFEPETQIVFTYNEIAEACSYFLESRKLGEGAYGAVYHGHLRNQDVAIKKMKASKSREFLAELTVLCKVHHSNLVELNGYAVGEQELYLVYEFVEHGALSDHLHNPAKRGYQPLSWTNRVQIALDAARGLEYIHDHTRSHYVHRDVKSSNILLDGNFRAKVGDFGLAKLVEQTGSEGEDVTTKVVGTVGYLAPEYIRDGQVTSKSDVYAFGVVLMELITGLEALNRSKDFDDKATDPRSLVALMYTLSHQGEMDHERLKAYVDPNLQGSFPEDGFCKMAKLARACVDEHSMARPDMREIVFQLSQILLTSIEWEASLAGSSQIFSGLIQGR